MSKKSIYSKFEKDLILKIKKQAESIPDGWIELNVPGDPSLKISDFKISIPKIPFQRWAYGARLHRFNDWPNVAPLGMKMQMDNRDHTDWWLLTNIPLKMAYSYGRRFSDNYEPIDPILVRKAELIEDAAWEYKFNVMDKRGENSVFLVSTKKEIEGRIFHINSPDDIPSFVERVKETKTSVYPTKYVAVVPHCGVEYSLVIQYAHAIITQKGNAAAHLVKIAREDKIPLILCPDAFSEYFENEPIKISNKRIINNH